MTRDREKRRLDMERESIVRYGNRIKNKSIDTNNTNNPNNTDITANNRNDKNDRNGEHNTDIKENNYIKNLNKEYKEYEEYKGRRESDAVNTVLDDRFTTVRSTNRRNAIDVKSRNAN